MSATMGNDWTLRAKTGFTRQQGIIRGVCADIAQRAGVPVWMPRVAFLICGLLHWILAPLAYYGLSRLLLRDPAQAGRGIVTDGPPPNAVRDRFSALDARLAAMETTTLQQETSLRRAFRDLERG